jgi:hypothetical protein
MVLAGKWRILRFLSILMIGLFFAPFSRALSANVPLTEEQAARFAQLALACVHQEYPNHVSVTLTSDSDVHSPRDMTPAFFGCLDWHSAVHGHWLLVRLLRQYPKARFADQARAAIKESLTAEHIATELAFLHHDGRASFERPYGLAWLLQLSAELQRWDDPEARELAATLQPLAVEVAQRVKSWLPKLHYPIRIGEHSQTAFSFGLIWDWAQLTNDSEMQSMLKDAGQRFYFQDRSCPLRYEPSGEDFLSPCLAEADLMRRLLGQKEFAKWLTNFLPMIPNDAKKSWLTPAIVTDRSDPKLAHIDGLNLSRAWMLEGIANALPNADQRRQNLLATATAHSEAAIPEVTGEHYEGGHWLGTFAVYLTTKAGMP